MSLAVPIVGINAKVTFTPSGGSVVTLKNASYKLQPIGNVKEAPNTTDGMVRIGGLTDYKGSVQGKTDVQATGSAIEAQVFNNVIGELKLYRDATRFWDCTAVIIDNLSIDAKVDEPEEWSFDFMKQSGTLTAPVYP
jgi:hypothetical protein